MGWRVSTQGGERGGGFLKLPRPVGCTSVTHMCMQAFYPIVHWAPDKGHMQGTITFELYDKDTFSDSHVATATLDLSSKSPHELKVQSLIFK
jgi:hypothetical protein